MQYIITTSHGALAVEDVGLDGEGHVGGDHGLGRVARQQIRLAAAA